MSAQNPKQLLKALDAVRRRAGPRGQDLPRAARKLAEAVREAVDPQEPRSRRAFARTPARGQAPFLVTRG